MRKLYYKNKLIIKLIKPFENKRLFAPLTLSIYTLKDYQLWPKELIALDPFSQTGLQWTRLFYDETKFLEMWDIDAQAITYAKKEFPKAHAVCGDSTIAIRKNLFQRKDFNFVLIDSPVALQYADGSFEHFNFFDQIFTNIADKAVIMINVVTDIEKIIGRHGHSSEFSKVWADARAQFYNVTEGHYINPKTMVACYQKRIPTLGYEIELINYNARNTFLGFITIAVSKVK
jgi:hypothetical protein